MPTAFFSVSNAASSPGAGADPGGYMFALFDELRWHPTLQASFAGALKYRAYNWLLRFIMKGISRGAGHTTDTSKNHEFTDWAKVREFADKISHLVPRVERLAPRA
jgi:menaquinone-dependent protoporphyrinogen oxidase